MLKFTTDGQDDGLADRRRTDDGWCAMTIAHFSFKFAQVSLKISTARVRKKFLTRARNLSLKKANGPKPKTHTTTIRNKQKTNDAHIKRTNLQTSKVNSTLIPN